MEIQHALMLCDRNHRFLFEVLPDRFPHGRLTHIEINLWAKYYDQQQQQRRR